jgi:phosphoribosyl 1,2-cyclic phosphodiesterase
MNLIILGSSSKGNCYLLCSESEVLIIECGVNISEIKKALNFSFAKVVGCVLTHEHMDHAKSAKEMMQMGINLYTSRGTIRSLALDVNHHRLKTIKAGEAVQIGSFKILPFKTQHDVAEPLGFIINHPETGNILFITDSFYVENTFRNLHNVIIEANFSQEIIDEKVRNGASPEFLRNRIFKSHMSLETCKKTLKANDLSKVNNIVLIHLSDGNSNATQFREEIEGLTGKNVHVADAGIIIENFNKQAF